MGTTDGMMEIEEVEKRMTMIGDRGRLPLQILVAVALAACAGGEPSAPGSAVRDSAGIRIVTNTGVADAVATWSTSEAVSIGEIEGPAEQTFNRLTDLAVAPDGGVVVLDGGDNLLKAYGPDGGFRFSAGGEGDGPSEFRGASLVFFRGDTLTVFDYRGPKLVSFTGAGEFLGSVRSGLTVFEFGFPDVWAPVPDGAIAVLGTGCSMPPPDDRRPKWKLMTLSPDGSVRDTVTIRNDRDYLAIYGERFCSSIPSPARFAENLAVRSDGLAAHGDGSAYQVAFFHLAASAAYDGELPVPERLVRLEAEAVPLTEADLHDHRRRFTEVPEEMPRAQAQDRIQAVEAALDTLDVPDHQPFFTALLWDSDGRLWVGRYAPDGAETRTWDVFSDEGERVGRVELPADVTVRAVAGSRVWATFQDELGVSYVKGYEVRQGPGRP